MAKELIKFSASWCGPCKAMKPVLENLLSEDSFKDVHFKEIDIDEDSDDLCGKYQIRSVPTLLAVDDNGKVLARSVGYSGEEKLREVVQAAI